MELAGAAREELSSYPILLMTEGKTDEQAWIVLADSLEPRGTDVVVRLRAGALGPIRNADVWRLRKGLDVADWEFTRSHWAVKQVDLLDVLGEAGFQVPRSLEELGGGGRSTPSREELLALRDPLAEWSHEELDDLVLLVGVEGLDAGRDIGSRRDRSTAIVRHAMQRPDAVTAGGMLLSLFLMGCAFDHATTPEGKEEDSTAVTRHPRRVFIVHGRDEEAKTSVASFVESVGLEPVILHEQPNHGRHLLTKFIEEADLVTFAIVLMTSDDLGGSESSSLEPRARQNVILELGYFLSHLGQPNVCALVSPGLETPSDFDGIVYVKLDPGESWQIELYRELKAAELPVKELP